MAALLFGCSAPAATAVTDPSGLKTWTVMETLLGTIGFALTLALALVLSLTL